MNSLIEQINSAGKSFIGFSLPMLVQSSILILLLLAADFLLRKKIRAVFRYCIWMLVLVKLIIPPSISSPVGIGNLFGDKLTEIKISSIEITPAQKEQALGQIQIPQLTISSPKPELYKEIYPQGTDIRSLEWQKEQAKAIEASMVKVEEQQKPVTAAMSITLQGALFASWIAVVLVLTILLLQRAIFVNGLVKQADEVTGGLSDVIQSCCKHLKIKNKIRLKISANAVSPAVCGLFRPVILLPTNLLPNLTKQELKACLLHELVHIKRGDLWINLFQTLLQIAYFYNPLLWLANAIIRRIREQAVDEAVQVALAKEAENYPQTLLNVARLAFKQPALSLRLIGVVESKSALKSRIARMLSRPIPKKAKLGLAGLITIFIIAAVLLPMASGVGEPTLVIKGTVTDSITGEQIAGAKVFDDGYGPNPDWQKVKAGEQSKWGAITDANGQYSYLTWPEHHTIKVESDGYESQNKSLYSSHLTLNKKDEEIFDFALTPVSKFSATLPNGVTVELVGICEHPSEGKQWWKPDGSPLEARPYEKFSSANSAGDKGYEIAYRIAANEGVVYEIKADNQTGSAGIDMLKEEKQLLSEFNNGKYYGGVFFIPQNFNKTDVRIGTVLEKNFETICSMSGDITKTITNCDNAFLYPAIEAEGKTYIHAEYHFTEGRKDAFRLIAIDTNDKQHLIKQGMRSESKKIVHCRMSTDLPVSEIKSIHFQTQPLQWVTFKNISLVPGQKTDVQIESEGYKKHFDLTSPGDFVQSHFEGWKKEVRNNYLLKDYEIMDEYVLEGKTGAVAYVWFKTLLEDVKTSQTKPFEAVYFLYRWYTDEWEGIYNTDGTNSQETEEQLKIYRERWLPAYLERVEQGYTGVGNLNKRKPPQEASLRKGDTSKAKTTETSDGQDEGEVESSTNTENIPEDVQKIDNVLQQWFKACRADDIEQTKKLLAPNPQPLEQNLQFTKMILQVIGDDHLIPAKVMQFKDRGITKAWAAFVTEKGFFFTGEINFITASLQKVKDNWLIAGIAFTKPEEFEETITSTKKQFPDAVIWQSDSYSNPADKTNALLKQKLQAFEKTSWNQLEGAPQQAKDMAGIVRKWIAAGLANDLETFKGLYTANGQRYAERNLKELQRLVFVAPDWLFSPMIIRISDSRAEVVSRSFVIKVQYPGYDDFTAVLNVQLMKADGKWGILTFSHKELKEVPNSTFKRKYPDAQIWYDKSTPDWLRQEQPTEVNVDIEALKSITETVKADYSFAEKVRAMTGEKAIFESYFPDSNEGGKALDEWWPQRNNDPDIDKKIFETVRNGLRKDGKGNQRQYRNQYITNLGSKYIWHTQQQNKDAVELLYYATYDKQLASDAVYYGLSVVKDKSEKIMKRLVELAMENVNVSRIVWGTQGRHNDLLIYLKPYLESKDADIKERAKVLEGVFKGEIDYGQWVNEQTAKRLQQGFGDKLEEIKEVLLKGNSNQRKEIFELIGRNQLNLLFDMSFEEPIKACFADGNPTVREYAIQCYGTLFKERSDLTEEILEVMDNLSRDSDSNIREAVAIFVGGGWIWGVTPQNPKAIEIMYRLSSDKDRSVSYDAVYYGLSVVENKDEKITKRLVDMAMDQTNDLGRIAWGLSRGSDMQVLKELLFSYLTPDSANAGRAGELYREIFKEEPPGAEQKSKEQQEEAKVIKPDEQNITFLQNLVNSAQEGAIVTIPKGTYKVPILINKTLTIKGEDANNCIFEVTMDGPAIVADTKGKGRVTIENLTIKWQLATSDRCDHPYAVFVKDTKVQIKNCKFLPLGNFQRCPAALRAAGFTNMTVSNCRFEGYNYTVQYGEGTEGTFRDSVVLNSGHQGVTLYDGAKATITGNIIAGSQYHGLRSTGGELNVHNNLITDNSRGIYLGNKPATGSVTNNLIINNPEGISSFGDSRVTVKNNIFSDSSFAGVDMRNSCKLNICDNIFINNEKALMLFKEGSKDNNTVSKNTFWKNKNIAENFELKIAPLETDPQFADANNGDFSLNQEQLKKQKQGLTKPDVFKNLWQKWQRIQSIENNSQEI